MACPVAANAMVSNGVSAVPVFDITARLVGIVSEGDLISRAENDTERRRSRWLELFSSTDTLAKEFVKSHARRVSDVMTDTRNAVARNRQPMEMHGIKRVPIV